MAVELVFDAVFTLALIFGVIYFWRNYVVRQEIQLGTSFISRKATPVTFWGLVVLHVVIFGAWTVTLCGWWAQHVSAWIAVR